MICLSIIMFLIAIGMFTARGDYSQFIIKIGEFFFIVWPLFLVTGILLILIGIGIYLRKTPK